MPRRRETADTGRCSTMSVTLRKKYIPMTETIYYTLLALVTPRHGYAVIQYVSSLTEGRLLLGTGTLYTMVGRLAADGLVTVSEDRGRKIYRITDLGRDLLSEETGRLERQLGDGIRVLGTASGRAGEEGAGRAVLENRGGIQGTKEK